jgi:hypothetical protein
METTSCSRRVSEPKCLLQLRYFLLLFPSVTISLQCDANSIQQVLVAEWLGQEFDCPCLESANTHWNVAVAGDKDYRNANISRCKLALTIESAQSIQSNVQHKATGRIRRFSIQEAFSRLKALNLQTYGAKQKLE